MTVENSPACLIIIYEIRQETKRGVIYPRIRGILPHHYLKHHILFQISLLYRMLDLLVLKLLLSDNHIKNPQNEGGIAMGGDCGNIYELRPVSIIRALPQIKDHRLFQLKLEDGTTWESFGHQPGQFIEVSIFGKGEAPISISSPPTRPDTLEICVRRTGKVTRRPF